MSKIKTAFFCSNCGYMSAKWQGKCPSCNQWNTMVEEVIEKDDKQENWKGYSAETIAGKAIQLNDIADKDEKRMITPDTELNRVLGGGIVTGSLVLVAGEPGIGKSTLFLQLGLIMKNCTVLYLSLIHI